MAGPIGGATTTDEARLSIGSAAADCADIEGMVSFWSAALGYRVQDRGRGYVYLTAAKPGHPGLFLQSVPDPTPGKNRWHIDLYAADEEAEAARIESLGATRVRRFEKDEGDIKGTILIVMHDVEDNEFCIVRA
jgi:predicted enzyme related to lactoylglutathione lyase